MNTNPESVGVDDSPVPPVRRRMMFSIKSFLVLTAVLGATAMSLGHLWRAANGNQAEIGQFVILTAMLPLIVLVGSSWFFKIFDRLIK